MRTLDQKKWFFSRFPTSQQIAAVYGVVVLIVYGWTLYWYAYQLPSWLYYLTVGELTATFAYSMTVNFLESLLVLVVPLALCVILPPRWFRDQFVAQGAAWVILSLFALKNYFAAILIEQRVPANIEQLTLLAGVGILVLSWLISKVGFLRKILEEIATRAIVFLYILIPISVISILIVLVRNIVEAFHV